MFSHGLDGSRRGDRIARARQLANESSPAADLLGFYAALAEYQQSLLERCAGETVGSSGAAGPEHRRRASLLDSLEPEWVLGAVRDLVSWLSVVAPPRLREAAHAMRDVTAGEWRERLDSYRSSPSDVADRFSETTVFVLEAVLQPLAERLASARQELAAASAGRIAVSLPARASGGPRCPVCGGSPVVGVLREEGHGARRALVCGLCLTEWDYLRLVCAGCGEQRFEALPVFTAEQFPHVRIEACDTCRSYLKTIDLTKDGRAVPVVDDIASMSLDLWARDRGYTRLRASLVRT
jgi:FdhE protein